MCQSPHLGEIQGIKRISKTPLRKETYTSWPNLSLDIYRKKSSTIIGLRKDLAAFPNRGD